MSHFATIQTEIKDSAALRAACEEMGLPVEENAEARGYYTNRTPGEFVIRLKGPYDIAVNRDGNGNYTLTTDWWEGHVEKEVGPQFGRLRQLYAVHKASVEARRKGYTVQRRKLNNGSIKLTIGGVK